MRVYSNDAVPTTLTSGVDSSASTIPVVDTTGWPDPGSGDEAVSAISHGEAGAVEVVTYTGKTATSLTGVTRGQDGTSAVSHDSGANVAHVASAADVEAVYSHASRHEPGGDDAMTVDAATGTGSLRTLGTGSQQAAAGDHSHALDDLSDVADTGGSEGDGLLKQGDGSWAPGGVGGGQVAAGTYTGDGVSDREINVGFEPVYVVVRNLDVSQLWTWLVMPAGARNSALRLEDGSNPFGTSRPRVSTNGFEVGNNEALANANGSSYRYVAFGT